jgi:hypothetical protein
VDAQRRARERRWFWQGHFGQVRKQRLALVPARPRDRDANSTFVAECGGKWTSAHRGDGVAAIYAKFKLTDAVVQAGMPNITAVIDGKDDILDPRDATQKFTSNGALVFYDWMKILREEGGFGAYADEIPDEQLDQRTGERLRRGCRR